MPKHYFRCSEHFDVPAKDPKIESLARRMAQSVGDSSFLRITARDFLLKGEVIVTYFEKVGFWAHHDPATVTIQGDRYYSIHPDGWEESPLDVWEGRHFNVWHCALNPVEGRGVPFDPKTGDEAQALCQFVEGMKDLYDCNKNVIDFPKSVWVTHIDWCKIDNTVSPD